MLTSFLKFVRKFFRCSRCFHDAADAVHCALHAFFRLSELNVKLSNQEQDFRYRTKVGRRGTCIHGEGEGGVDPTRLTYDQRVL